MKRLLSSIFYLSLTAFTAQAAERIPEEGGLSGFINLGAGVAKVESNTLAGMKFGDLGDDRISSLTGSPDSETLTMPVAAFELAYTFAGSRTQLIFGNSLEDYVRFDFATRMAVRQEVSGLGTLGLNYLSTPIKTEVWSDPYATNTKRSDTDRDSTGYRLTWDHILDSDWEVRYSNREVDIDNETSGSTLGLSAANVALLDRNGDMKSTQVLYTMRSGKHIITPQLSYTEHDLDGDAMSYDGYSLFVNHRYMDGSFVYVTNVGFGSFDYDESNPVPAFNGKKASKDRIGGSFTTFYANPWGIEDWTFNAGVVWYKEDNDIDFYDNEVKMISAGMMHKF